LRSAAHRPRQDAEMVTPLLLSCFWSDPTDSADRTAESWSLDESGRTRSHRRPSRRPLLPLRLPPDIPTAPVAADWGSGGSHETPLLVAVFVGCRFHPAGG